MTTYTKSDLAIRILRDAGLIGAEETPSSADLIFAEETLSSEIDLMAAKNIVIWDGSEDEIPNKYYTALSRRVALVLAPSFGLGTLAESTAAIPTVERDLRILATNLGGVGPSQGEYF
jgi:hypothetical protein